MAGAAQWAFKDFATALRSDNPIPRINQKGLVTRDLTPKESYFVFQSYWCEKPMVRLYGHTWPVRWGKPGERRLVRVYSNCRAVELFLNGDSAGVKKRDSRDFPAAGLRWRLPFREGENELRAITRGTNGGLEDRIRFTYQTQEWSAPARLTLAVAGQDERKTTVEAHMLDASGVRCLDSRALVYFSLAGDGRLEDNLGTPTGSRVVEMYNGRVQISLTHAGPVVAGVHAAGVDAAFLPIPAS
jgi:beta-galactosidase